VNRATDTLLKYWPVLVVGAGVVASSAVDSWRLNAQAEDLREIEDATELNGEEIEAIQRLLIQRQGEVDLRTQRIEIEQQAQGDDLAEILRLLEELTRGD
jgi:hypothetical protein